MDLGNPCEASFMHGRTAVRMVAVAFVALPGDEDSLECLSNSEIMVGGYNGRLWPKRNTVIFFAQPLTTKRTHGMVQFRHT